MEGLWYSDDPNYQQACTNIHKHTFKNASVTSGDNELINFFHISIYIYVYTKFLASPVFLLVNSVVAKHSNTTFTYSATLITLPACCHCSLWSSCCLPSGMFFLNLINS